MTVRDICGEGLTSTLLCCPSGNPQRTRDVPEPGSEKAQASRAPLYLLSGPVQHACTVLSYYLENG